MFVVAGASGRTGGAVAETLLSQNHSVRVIVRDPSKVAALRARGAEVRIASLDDPRAIEKAIAGAKGFFTLLPEDLAVPDFHAHRRRIADATAAAVRASRVPHVVFLSAQAASLADGNGPAKDLHYAEDLLRASATKLTVIRAVYFQDNVVAAADAARREGVYPSFFPSADLPFPTVATKDVGRLAAHCLVEPPPGSEVVDILGPAYSVRDMADRLGRAIGKTLRVVDVPPPAQLDMLIQRASLPRPFAEALVEMFACFASGRVRPQGDRAERATTELDEVLRQHLGDG